MIVHQDMVFQVSLVQLGDTQALEVARCAHLVNMDLEIRLLAEIVLLESIILSTAAQFALNAQNTSIQASLEALHARSALHLIRLIQMDQQVSLLAILNSAQTLPTLMHLEEFSISPHYNLRKGTFAHCSSVKISFTVEVC
jgi:hypothetical protein